MPPRTAIAPADLNTFTESDPVALAELALHEADTTNVHGIPDTSQIVSLPIPESGVTNLVSDLAGKAATSHTHAESEVTNLVTDLAAKQPLDADLTAIAALTSASDKAPYSTGAGTWALLTMTAYARTLLDDPDAATARTTLGAAATSHTHAESDITNLTTDLAAKQPLDTDLTAIAALTSAADKIPYSTGVGTWALSDLSAFGRTLINDADAATARTTIGASATSHHTNHSKGGSDAIALGDIATVIGDVPQALIDAIMPWRVFIVALQTPDANTGFTGMSYPAAPALQVYRGSGIQNNFYEYNVPLAAGTWTFILYGAKSTSYGIGTLSLDGTDVGTIDFYNASLLENQVMTITGIVVATTGKKAARVRVVTKNGSSSSYDHYWNAIEFRRTA